MKNLTNSQRNSFFSCPRRWQFENILCRRPIETGAALAFGTAFHSFLEKWWLGEAILEGIGFPILPNKFENAKLDAMCKAYDAFWDGERGNFSNAVTELKFSIPITANTNKSRWEYSGKIDAVVKHGGDAWLVEHKTTSQDISAGSEYWSRLEMDGQIEGYMLGYIKAYGIVPKGVVYDVAKKPCIKPLRQDKPNPETPEEYGQRCHDKIMENPGSYFKREKIHKTAGKIDSFEKTVYHSARMIDYCMNNDFFPTNSNSCKGFGTCPYFEVCAGNADIADSNRFTDSTQNPELKEG